MAAGQFRIETCSSRGISRSTCRSELSSAGTAAHGRARASLRRRRLLIGVARPLEDRAELLELFGVRRLYGRRRVGLARRRREVELAHDGRRRRRRQARAPQPVAMLVRREKLGALRHRARRDERDERAPRRRARPRTAGAVCRSRPQCFRQRGRSGVGARDSPRASVRPMSSDFTLGPRTGVRFGDFGQGDLLVFFAERCLRAQRAGTAELDCLAAAEVASVAQTVRAAEFCAPPGRRHRVGRRK